MKMSMCNTIRFFAVTTTIVLSVVGGPIPGLLKQQENVLEKVQDLQHQESITVELKNNIKRQNDINSLKLNNLKDDTNSMPLDAESLKKNVNKNSYQTITTSSKVTQDTGADDKTTQIPQEPVTENQQPTSDLNMTLLAQQEKATLNKKNKNKIINPVTLLQTIEKKNLFEQDMRFQSNDTIYEKQTEETTKIELENSTQVKLLDIEEDTEITNKVVTETSEPFINTEAINVETSGKPKESSLSSSEFKTPTWKKYNVIERKRVSTTTDELLTSTDTSMITETLFSTISEVQPTVTDKTELMVKSESAQGRISLQDAITSDIPSLEKLKSDLLSFSRITNKSDTDANTPLFSTDESIIKIDATTLITTTFPSTFYSELSNTVSSKRAGYLDLSAKNTTENDENLKPNGTESVQGPFDADSPDVQDELPDDKVASRVESQSQLAEDAIKEELLKEELLHDNEEISQRNRDAEKQIETDKLILPNTGKTDMTQFDDKSTHDDNLSVRPINSDKVKNMVLYPVNPNYKPLKKIEVQPAKPFVRDPDDNSWRNESLSSLGIVFKPKNSSKPFTQVLKNKTETEWNNLTEKDTKSEVPDLRVRLEQIAQKRKSKKKKIDSFGNIFYTDYEENSSSEESTSIPKDLRTPSLGTVPTPDVSTSGIAIVTPIQTTTLSISTGPVSRADDVPVVTTTASPAEQTKTTPKKELTKVTTLKPPKTFNLFDYYETNDDEDITEYLNMAKIDLKKYTVPIHTTYTPYTSPPLSILYTNPTTQYTPERKGTIQYFPPRTTTKRPRKNNYYRENVNSLTLTESPKHVLPISYHKLTTHYDDMMRKNIDRNIYLTTPPLATLPNEDFGVIANEGEYRRPNYVVKHFKDYMNEAIQEEEHGKNREYAFTESPVHDVTIPAVIKPTTVREKTTVTDDYDYETVFRKDLLDRFVANFNQKSNRFKSDFPVVYNNSIVHGASYDEKDVAMSRSYFRRPFGNQDYKPIVHDLYDPNCENVTVELSPAYELHYYVPEQEEKQEVEAKPINLPVRYSL